jgi:hypothetical protein
MPSNENNNYALVEFHIFYLCLNFRKWISKKEFQPIQMFCWVNQ